MEDTETLIGTLRALGDVLGFTPHDEHDESAE
jgi:hypothetical protein